MFDWQNFVALIPITVVVSIVVFLIRFFGRVVADLTPFADDRRWLEDLTGIRFFTTYILSPIVWIFLFSSNGLRFWLFSKENFWLLIISFVNIIVLWVISKKALDFFSDENFDEGNILTFAKKVTNFKNNTPLNNGDWLIILKYLFLYLVSLFILVILWYFYKWHAYYHVFIGIMYLFSHFTLFAVLLSLSRRNILLANIKFIDSNLPDIKSCRILKVNNDNVRIKTDDGVSVINKSLIFRIDCLKHIKS